MSTSTLKTRALSLAALALTGCAVLTVEVDVYKGPLANDENVQMAQVVTLAMGTKPLLVALRDDLEWPSQATPGGKEEFRDETWYRDGYIRPYDGGKSHLHNEDARRVNDVLGLYEDLSKHAASAASVIEAASLLRAATKELRDSNDEIQAVANTARALSAGADDETEKRALATATADFVEAKEPGRNERDPERRMLEKAKAVAGKDAPPWLKLDWNNPRDTPANLAFETLARETNSATLVGLFVEQGPAHEAIVGAVVRRAKAFVASRAAARATLLALLDLIEEIAIDQDLSKADRARMLSELAAPTAKLIQPRYLLAGLSIAEPNAQLASDLRAAAPSWDGNGYELANRVVESGLSDPQRAAETVRAIRVAHVAIRGPATPDDEELANPRRRDYGVTAGPPEHGSDENASALSVIAANVLSATNDVRGTVLEGGRVSDGVETLITKYLNAYYDDPDAWRDPGPELANVRARLLHTLVEFANKVTVMANDYAIAHAEDGRETLARAAFVNAPNRIVHLFSSRNMNVEYARTLQSAGNSIIAQVDPLMRRFEHERQLPDLFDRARTVAEGAGAFVEEHEKGEPVGMGAFMALEASLEDHLAELCAADTKGQNTEIKRHVEKCLELVHQMSLRAIFTPSPTSYLRTSYTASSLQDGSGITWSNDLRSHLGHAWPLEQILGWFKTDTSATLAEVDKQFWQNINRVKVEAAGNTNYVIAKDDIGNWYVKGFEGDPKPLVDAAKAVAGSAIGAGAFVNPYTGAAGTAAAPSLSRDAVATEFLSLRDSFRSATDEHLRAVSSAATDLPDRVLAAWQGRANGADDKAAADARLTSMKSDQSAARSQHLLAVAQLRAIPKEDFFATDARIAEGVLSIDRYGARVAALLDERAGQANGRAAKAKAAVEKAAADKTTAEKAKQTAAGDAEKAKAEKDAASATLKGAEEAVATAAKLVPLDPDKSKKAAEDLEKAKQGVRSADEKVTKAAADAAAADSAIAKSTADETKAKADEAKAVADAESFTAASGDAKRIVLEEIRALVARRRQAVEAFKRGLGVLGVVAP